MKQLCEAHGHIFMDGEDYLTAATLHKNSPVESDIRDHLAAYRERGITWFRDGGDHLGVSLLAAKLAPEYGIRYSTPAFGIHRKGRYGGIVGRGYSDMAQFRTLVTEAVAHGASFIKIMFSGLLEFDRYGHFSCEPLPGDEIRELVSIVHGEGLAVMAHVNGAEPIRAALEAGTDSIEHGYYMDDDCLRLLAESGAVWVPTLAAIKGFDHREGFCDEVVERILAEQQEKLCRAAGLGALIATGSDAGAVAVPHGEGLFTEFRLLEEALGPDWETITDRGNRVLMKKFWK